MTKFTNTPILWLFVVLSSVAFQITVPNMGDEAYFISWGHSLTGGVYDHPALPAWISFMLLKTGQFLHLPRPDVLHRSLSIGLGILALWLVYRRAKQGGWDEKAPMVVATLAVIPGFLMLFNLYTNDTILAFLVLIFLLSSERVFLSRKISWPVLLSAGVSLGLMALTKYNGGIFYLGLVIAVLLSRHLGQTRFLRLLLISLIAGVIFSQNLWWNYQNCSVNFAFNFSFRSGKVSGLGPVEGALALLVAAGPIGIALLVARIRNKIAGGFYTNIFLISSGLILLISTALSRFDVHWAGALCFLAILSVLEQRADFSFARLKNWTFALTAILIIPFVIILAIIRFGDLSPDGIFNSGRTTLLQVSLDIDSGAIPEALHLHGAGRILSTDGYTTGASIENAMLAPVVVISKSFYGRNQDLMTDFRALDGKNFLILATPSEPHVKQYESLFDSVQLVNIKTDRRNYTLVLGDGFRFETYAKDWINPVITMFYDQSKFPYGKCFMDKYR